MTNSTVVEPLPGFVKPKPTRDERIRAQEKIARKLYPYAQDWQIDIVAELSATEFSIWQAFAAHGTDEICGTCLQEKMGERYTLGNNGSGPLRDMRNKSFEITRGRSASGCASHSGTVTWRAMRDPLPYPGQSKSRALYNASELKDIRKTLGSTKRAPPT